MQPRIAVTGSNLNATQRFPWEIASIRVYLEDLQSFWAAGLGITTPQLRILMALADHGSDAGMPVSTISRILHVNPSFITTQSKCLERLGFVCRQSSSEDARIVRLSLADSTFKRLAALRPQAEKLEQFIFAEFRDSEIVDLSDKLARIKNRLAKARLALAADT